MPFGQAARDWFRAGFGPLPIPAGRKFPPPTGYTGPDADDPTGPQIDQWIAQGPTANVAVRMPEGVIGIDVDHYDDKTGGDTITELEKRLGPLPATWTSTSRPGTPAGIRLYRVPVGVKLRGQAGAHVDIVQRGHRYALVAPSIHPDGREYVIIGPDGNVTTRPPKVDDLPALPDAWLDHLRADNTPDPILDRRATTRRAASGRSPAVDRALGRAITDMRGGRHDAATAGAMALARLEELGHPGAAAALATLGDLFIRDVTADGSRSEREARGEWHRIVTSARRKAATTPSTVPTYDEAEAERQAAHEARRAAQAEERAAFDEIVAGVSFSTRGGADPARREEPRRLTVESAGDLARRLRDAPRPRFLIRRLIIERDYGVMAAAWKVGKTWLTLDIAVCVATGHPLFGHYDVDVTGRVLVFLGEGGEWKTLRRLDAVARAHGLDSAEDLGDRVLVCFRSPKLTSLDSMAEVESLLAEHRPVLTILDPLYLSMGGADSARLYDMGDALSRIQHACQDAASALLVVHHFNRNSGAGTGSARMSGAGPAEWGRFLLSLSSETTTTDTSGRATTVLNLAVQGDSTADHEVKIRRRIWADDIDDPTSTMHYEAEVIEDGVVGVVSRLTSNLNATQRKALDVLEAQPDRWFTVADVMRDLGDAAPKSRNTVRSALDVLARAGIAETFGADRSGAPGSYRLKSEKERNVPI